MFFSLHCTVHIQVWPHLCEHTLKDVSVLSSNGSTEDSTYGLVDRGMTRSAKSKAVMAAPPVKRCDVVGSCEVDGVALD